jgi:hypothetical protein
MTRRPVVIGRVCSNDIHSPCSGDCGLRPDPRRSLIRWQRPTSQAPSRCDRAWFEIEPQRAPGPMWLLESADRSRVRVVVASKALRNVRVRSTDQLTSGNEREMMEADSSETLRKACQYELKTKSSKERSPTELPCASFPPHHRRVMQMESN